MFNNNQFSESEINQLKQCRDNCQNIRLKERFIALILFATLSVSKFQIAEIIGKSEKTIENWLSIYYVQTSVFCPISYQIFWTLITNLT